MYLLDTNVLSEFRKIETRRGEPSLAGWQQSVRPTDFFVSVVTILEIEKGIHSVAGRDPAQSMAIRRWLETQVMDVMRGNILPVSVEVALRCAPLHVPDPAPFADALIAATAMVHGLTVVTRNTRDFAPMGVAVFDPWAAG